MLREISEEVRVNLKDRLRDIRQGVRQFRHDSGRPLPQGAQGRPPFPIGPIEGLLGHAVSAFDDAMSVAETFVPRRVQRPERAVARSLAIYFPAGSSSQAGERTFRRDFYYLAQTVLAKQEFGAVVIHEASLAAVHATVRKRHADRITALNSATGPDERTEAAASLCSALLIALMEHRPIRLADRVSPAFTPLDRAAEIRALATVALACGIATVDANGAASADLLELAGLAVGARLDRIERDCATVDADGELTSTLAMLLSHLA